MEIDVQTTGIAALLIAAGGAFARWAWLRLLDRVELWIFASAERNRRREVKRKRRESSGPLKLPGAVPIEVDEETTDTFHLVEMERKARKSPGERPPRPGTHHDRED